MERPTNQKQEEKKAKIAEEGWRSQRTQGKVLPRGKEYEGKRKKLNEELRIRKERKECDNTKENINAMMARRNQRKRGKENENQLSKKENEANKSCYFSWGKMPYEERGIVLVIRRESYTIWGDASARGKEKYISWGRERN